MHARARLPDQDNAVIAHGPIIAPMLRIAMLLPDKVKTLINHPLGASKAKPMRPRVTMDKARCVMQRLHLALHKPALAVLPVRPRPRTSLDLALQG